MGQPVSVDIGSGFYQSDALSFSNQRCVNLYPNIPQAPALKQTSLFNVQGISQIAITSRLARDRNRGAWVFDSVPYFLNGDTLFRVDQNITFGNQVTYEAVAVGEVPGQGFCSFSDNGNQLIIINQEGQGFIYQPTGNPQFQEITTPEFSANGVPQQVVFVDSFFIVTTDLDRAIVSAPNNGLAWDALDFFTAEADPDGIVAPFVYRNQLYLLGTETTETYQNIGGAGVPFQRINGFFLTQGCSAPFSVQTLGDSVLWVGRGENEQPSIYQFTGSIPQKVSTIAIDNRLHELSEADLGNIFSWSYSLRGNEFVAFTSRNFTFVYDTTTGRWHERSSSVTDRNGNRLDIPCRIQSVVNAYNEILVGDSEDGRIGLVDSDIYREYDEPLISFFTSSPLYDLGTSFTLPRIELLCENGVGNENAPDPEVRLQISRNGRFFEQARTRKLGTSGQYQLRQMWRKNGRVDRYCVFKITVSDPVKRRLFGLELDVKRGSKLA